MSGTPMKLRSQPPPSFFPLPEHLSFPPVSLSSTSSFLFEKPCCLLLFPVRWEPRNGVGSWISSPADFHLFLIILTSIQWGGSSQDPFLKVCYEGAMAEARAVPHPSLSLCSHHLLRERFPLTLNPGFRLLSLCPGTLGPLSASRGTARPCPSWSSETPEEPKTGCPVQPSRAQPSYAPFLDFDPGPPLPLGVPSCQRTLTITMLSVLAVQEGRRPAPSQAPDGLGRHQILLLSEHSSSPCTPPHKSSPNSLHQALGGSPAAIISYLPNQLPAPQGPVLPLMSPGPLDFPKEQSNHKQWIPLVKETSR